MNPALMYSALRLNGRRTGAAPAPDPVPEGLTLQMTAEYVDEDGDLQTATADNTTTPTITGVAPFQVRFDGRGSRSTDVNCDDEAGAVTRMGWRYDFGGAATGTWSLTGHAKNQIDRVPFTTFVFENAGTFSVRQYSRDTEGRQGYITMTVTVSAPGAGTDIAEGGSWPTFASNTVYNLAAGTDHTAKGTLSLNGLHNVLIRKTGSGADPIVSQVYWDTRNVVGTATTRTRNCRIDGINTAVVGETSIGPLYCSVLNHSDEFYYQPGVPLYYWTIEASTQAEKDNIAYPRGVAFWNCNRITSWGDHYVFIWASKNCAFRNCTLDKTSGDTGQHIFRGGYDGLDLSLNLLRSSVATMSMIKITGFENGTTFDTWDSLDRYGVWNGAQYQPVCRMNVIKGNILGDATATAHSGILIEVMPENDEAGSPDQANELVLIRDNVCYEADLGLRYIGVGGRNIAYSNNLMDMGAGDPIQVGTELRYNRVPAAYQGPYISTAPPEIT